LLFTIHQNNFSSFTDNLPADDQKTIQSGRNCSFSTQQILDHPDLVTTNIDTSDPLVSSSSEVINARSSPSSGFNSGSFDEQFCSQINKCEAKSSKVGLLESNAPVTDDEVDPYTEIDCGDDDYTSLNQEHFGEKIG